MYILKIRNKASKSLKRIKRSVSKVFFEEFKKALKDITINPECGDPLVGNLSGFFKLKIIDDSRKYPEYRVVYQFYKIEYINENPDDFNDIDFDGNENGLVEVVILSSREQCNNYYKDSKWFDEFRRD